MDIKKCLRDMRENEEWIETVRERSRAMGDTKEDVLELLESLETPEHSEHSEHSESPEHPESPRPDFFSSGINNKKQETLTYTSWGRYG